jgi:DNA-binding CsgD family transcriptional regulator
MKYKLDDNEIWSEVPPDDLIRFNYLNFGSHVLNLTAEDKSSPEKNRSLQLGFTIFPPWYLHWIAFVVYLSLIGCSVFLISKLNRFRLRSHKLAYLKNIKTEHTRRIQRMKEQNLEKEIKNKSKELVNYTILLRKKNEVLQNIQEILNKDGLPENKMKSKVLQIVDQNLSDRKEWEIFQLHFDEAHSDFLKKLKLRHPDLTPNDLRFCAFLRMNMTSKEISFLLNMSLRSIEVKRYRLRLKLGLEHDHNLVDYIMTIE